MLGSAAVALAFLFPLSFFPRNQATSFDSEFEGSEFEDSEFEGSEFDSEFPEEPEFSEWEDSEFDPPLDEEVDGDDPVEFSDSDDPIAGGRCIVGEPSEHTNEPNNPALISKSLLIDWALSPQTQLEGVLTDALAWVVPQFMAYANASPWPDLHTQAQQARVPIMMYHDILPEMEVFFDVTPDRLEEDFQLIQDEGLTPVSLDQLVDHLRSGLPLPEKPILLTFDDGYVGHYEHVYPLLKEYNYPAAFSIFTAKVDGDIVGRSTVTWSHLEEMAADPLVTILSHGIAHPPDLTELTDDELESELVQSKEILESKLGIPIKYFTYPEGNHDDRVVEATASAGYEAAFSMDDFDERFAGDSESLLAISRFGQSRLLDIIDQAWGGPPAPKWNAGFDFNSPVLVDQPVVDDIPFTLISGGKPFTVHGDSRYQLPELIADTGAVAAVDGGFFSLEYLNSNVMIGPVFSRLNDEFIPGNSGENPLLNGRPLVLINEDTVNFVPFDADRHNTLSGVQEEMEDVMDAFVAAGFLVRKGQPQPAESFGTLFDYDATRHRAFWGINQQGQPVVGVSNAPVDSVHLGEILAQVGFQDAVMLDSGASTSLAYEGESMVGYIPRPVPHAVALWPPEGAGDLAQDQTGPHNCVSPEEEEDEDYDLDEGDPVW